jgi:Ca2+-binding RTX toxin-like protein
MSYKYFVIMAALTLSMAGSAAAQDATCPAANRLHFTPFGSPPIDIRDGANYTIILGRATSRGGGEDIANGAFVTRNGVCLGFLFVGVGAPISEPGMNTHGNLCLGSGIDHVSVVTTTGTQTCGAVSASVMPFNYNGFRLTMYGGGGSDTLGGGSGLDTLYGGAGADALGSVASPSDRFYGESGADWIAGSSGNSTIASGGGNDDLVYDGGGTSDTLEGGSGNDMLDSMCHTANFACGSGTDEAYSPDFYQWFSSCESWIDESC